MTLQYGLMKGCWLAGLKKVRGEKRGREIDRGNRETHMKN
jgi:hypothetical protein